MSKRLNFIRNLRQVQPFYVLMLLASTTSPKYSTVLFAFSGIKSSVVVTHRSSSSPKHEMGGRWMCDQLLINYSMTLFVWLFPIKRTSLLKPFRLVRAWSTVGGPAGKWWWWYVSSVWTTLTFDVDKATWWSANTVCIGSNGSDGGVEVNFTKSHHRLRHGTRRQADQLGYKPPRMKWSPKNWT